MYYKHKGYYYILGMKNVYKMGRLKFIVLNEKNTNTFEKKIITQLKEESRKKVLEYNALLQNILLKCEAEIDDGSIS